MKLAAIAERHRGVAAGADSFALLWLGYGIGLATDLGGVLLRGARGGAGEIGYLPLYHSPARTSGPTRPAGLLIGGPAVHPARRRVTESAPNTSGEAITAAIALGRTAFIERPRSADRLRTGHGGRCARSTTCRTRRRGRPGRRDEAARRRRGSDVSEPHLDLRRDCTGGDVQIAVTAVADDAVLLGGLDAGLHALRESLISSLAQTYTRLTKEHNMNRSQGRGRASLLAGGAIAAVAVRRRLHTRLQRARPRRHGPRAHRHGRVLAPIHRPGVDGDRGDRQGLRGQVPQGQGEHHGRPGRRQDRCRPSAPATAPTSRSPSRPTGSASSVPPAPGSTSSRTSTATRSTSPRSRRPSAPTPSSGASAAQCRSSPTPTASTTTRRCSPMPASRPRRRR